MLRTKFQESEPSGSEDGEFLVFFYVFLLFKPRIPRYGAILDIEIFKLGKGPLGNSNKNVYCMYIIIKSASNNNNFSLSDTFVYGYLLSESFLIIPFWRVFVIAMESLCYTLG